MNQKTISINIPIPCSERWEEMQITEDGRYCGSCAKTVIDFTQYSDVQLIEFFSKQKGSVCGHFRKVQLGRRLQPMAPQSRLFPVILLTAGMLLAAGVTTAQQLPPQTKSATTVSMNKKVSPHCKKVPAKKVKPSRKRSQVVIEEFITEETGTAVVDPPPVPPKRVTNELPGGVQKVDSIMVKPHE